jgi:hypothetical protein
MEQKKVHTQSTRMGVAKSSVNESPRPLQPYVNNSKTGDSSKKGAMESYQYPDRYGFVMSATKSPPPLSSVAAHRCLKTPRQGNPTRNSDASKKICIEKRCVEPSTDRDFQFLDRSGFMISAHKTIKKQMDGCGMSLQCLNNINPHDIVPHMKDFKDDACSTEDATMCLDHAVETLNVWRRVNSLLPLPTQ